MLLVSSLDLTESSFAKDTTAANGQSIESVDFLQVKENIYDQVKRSFLFIFFEVWKLLNKNS